MKIGIVVLNYNNAKECISIVKKLAEYESVSLITIVDNCSNDNSYSLLNCLKLKKTVILKSDENGGYARGNNIGLKYLIENSCDVLFISNPDVTVDEEAIKRVACFLVNNPTYGMAAPRIFNFDNKPVKLYGMHEVSYYEAVLSNFLTRKKVVEKKINQPNENEKGIYDSFFLYGSLWAARNEAILKCDYLDSNTFLYREEEIMGKRMKKNGYKAAYLLDVKYIHNHPYKEEKMRKKIHDMKILQKSDYYMWRTYYSIGVFRCALLRCSYSFCRLTHAIAYKLEDIKNGK